MDKRGNFYSAQLDNGLKIIFEKRKIPVVSTIVATKFGSSFESEKLKGIAHFIEHSVFKGTKKRNQKEISKEVEKKGGKWNAFTAEEETAFWIKLRSEYLQTSLDLLSDIMLNPSFKKKEIETERGVILEEIKMYHDLPQYYVLDKLKESLYHKPFGLSGLGTKKLINNVPISVLVKNHHKYYNPSNMVLSIVGKSDFDFVKSLSKNYFSRHKKGYIARTINPREGSFSKIIEKRKSIDQAQIALGFHMPSRLNRSRYSAELFNAYLGEGMSSPLFQEIREKRGLAYSVRGLLDQGSNYGYCAISVGTVKEKVEQVKELILQEIKKVRNLSRRDLEETKEQLIGNYYLGMENSMKTAQNLLYEELTGNAEEYYNYPERISSIKLKDVQKLTNFKDYGYIAVVPE